MDTLRTYLPKRRLNQAFRRSHGCCQAYGIKLIGELLDGRPGERDRHVGVPGTGKPQHWGIVTYDVLNIPNWKEIPLKALIEEEIQSVPVYVDNDCQLLCHGGIPLRGLCRK